MTIIRHVNQSDDVELVRELFWEYLQWANERVNEEFGVSFDIEAMLVRDMAHLEVFSPPEGRLVVVAGEAEIAGIGGLKHLADSVGEIKRMFVRPRFRGMGLGRVLLETLLADARLAGYDTVRLDSAGFMGEAHALYRSVGFKDISPYAESEIPVDFQRHWVFMEKKFGL